MVCYDYEYPTNYQHKHRSVSVLSYITLPMVTTMMPLYHLVSGKQRDISSGGGPPLPPKPSLSAATQRALDDLHQQKLQLQKQQDMAYRRQAQQQALNDTHHGDRHVGKVSCGFMWFQHQISMYENDL